MEVKGPVFPQRRDVFNVKIGCIAEQCSGDRQVTTRLGIATVSPHGSCISKLRCGRLVISLNHQPIRKICLEYVRNSDIIPNRDGSFSCAIRNRSDPKQRKVQMSSISGRVRLPPNRSLKLGGSLALPDHLNGYCYTSLSV